MLAPSTRPARLALPLTALGLALSLAPAEAAADELYGTRGGSQMGEVGHTIELSFERGYATLTVERTVHNGIDRHDEAQFWIDVPMVGVATGLRSLGELDGRPKWFEAELLEAEAAAARYRELTGLGAYYPKDPALLSWRHSGLLALQVFPVAPHTDKTVEYTIEMPASWEDGRWNLWLPQMGTAENPAELRIEPEQQLDQLFVDGEVVARGHYERLDHDLSIALAPRDPTPYSLELASASTGPRNLVHWRVTLAPEISTIPREAQIVIVLDLSKSAADAVEAQRELALAYLRHFEDPALGAEVALLGFDREIHSLSPGLVSAGEASELLRTAQLSARNGSELGLALDAASQLLGADKPGRRGARRAQRVVVLGDFETAMRVSPNAVAQASALGDALVHLVETEQGRASLEREDGHAWAQLAAATGGVAWGASAGGDWAEDGLAEDTVAVFEELARPVRIDDFHLAVPGLDVVGGDELYDFGGPLDEGQGLGGLTISATAATALRIEGRLWNTPLHESTKPSAKLGDRWSALVFGNESVYPELSEDEMMVLAMRGGAVSPVTSYLAIEPGVRPSTEGIERGEGWGSAFGVGASGRGVIGIGARGIQIPSFDKQAWLEGELVEAWQMCGGAGHSATLSLETMTTELLDVGLSTAASDAGLRACIEQVAWSLDLPGVFESREQWTVEL